MSSVLIVSGLSKSYSVPTTEKKRRQTLQALSNISFSVEQGEWFGIIGPNGSGKSTLLKCLAGIYQPDKGRITVSEKTMPVLALGAGFTPELTARENVYLNGLGLGLERAQIDALYPKIMEFAELAEFSALPLMHYSDGMIRRLGLTIVLKAASPVLLLDEVFTAGDLAFKNKSLATLKQLKSAGHTIVMVSHGLERVKKYCDRALYLRSGRLEYVGSAAAAVGKYRDREQVTLAT